MTQFIDRYDNLIEWWTQFLFPSLFFPGTPFDLVFCSVVWFSYFCWNYFLNNFSLLDGLLILVCLLMIHSYFIIIIIDQQNVHIFSDDTGSSTTCSSTTIFILLTYSTNKLLLLNIFSCLLLQTIFYLLTPFLCFAPWINCHLLAD